MNEKVLQEKLSLPLETDYEAVSEEVNENGYDSKKKESDDDFDSDEDESNDSEKAESADSEEGTT
ncbi:hypothetical protein Bhyg_01647 [Pseudolycoriella hygida]|uniref:Uncharacterized protein n=1 Tax=Pseudolycoriella hygida TaxID=35572 RepID=A0A9Q0N9T3_9DIPT|nr:hypothetical protein Bhyg_01647 [Pseudolycoriella hygida]